MVTKIKKFLADKKFFLIGLMLTSFLLWPFFAAPYFTHHDDVQAIRLYEMDKCIKDLQIPCRWVPDLGGLYGYPLFNYYAPLPFYIGEIFYLITDNLIFSVKLMFSLAMIFSYVFMYLLTRKLWGEMGGVISGVAYSFAPYHAVDLYVRGAMGEMWALMIFPAVFWSLFRLKEEVRILNVLILSVAVSGLFLSHNLSAMIFMPILIAAIGFLYWQTKNLNLVKFSFLAVMLGFLISAFYIIPAYLEKDLVHIDTTTFGYFSYTEHFKGFKKLFLERSWGWGSSIREVPGGEKDGLSYQIGIVHIVLWIVSLLTAFVLWKQKRQVALWIIFSSVIIAASSFLINPRSVFIWNLIEPLKYLQFPWRFLMIVIFFVSVVSGSMILLTGKNYQKILLWILSILALFLLNFNYFRPEKFIDLKEKDLLSGERWDRQVKRSIFDYLPKSAQAPPAELATKRYEVVVGEPVIENFKEGSNWTRFNIINKDFAILRLSTYYFPEWRVTIDGKKVEINPRNELGLITFAIDPGTHFVEARLYDTPTRTVANFISVLGIFLFVILTMTQFKKTRYWLIYYIKGVS